LLSFAACGRVAREAATPGPEAGAPALDLLASTAPATTAEALGAATSAWGWTTEAVEGAVTALAPTSDGGAVVLVSETRVDGLPLYLGWFDSGGELVAVRSLAGGQPESVRLARPGLVVTPDGVAVLAFSITCAAGRCPELAGAAIETGAHLAVFSRGGEAWHVALGAGDVESLAVNEEGQVAVALAGADGAAVRVLDLTGSVVLDLFMPRLGGAMRLAFAGDGALFVGRGSTLRSFGGEGRLLSSLDVGGGFAVEHLAAAGDRIAVVGTRPDLGSVIAVLDATGSVRWVARGLARGIAVEPGGAVAAVGSLEVGKLDAAGTMVWSWPAGQPTIFPNPIDVEAVAFARGGVLAGGVLNGRDPFVVLLRDSTSAAP
jgi:hypothetical protein